MRDVELTVAIYKPDAKANDVSVEQLDLKFTDAISMSELKKMFRTIGTFLGFDLFL